MRLHRLRLRAFGPFPGDETVDFDSLASGGLFLLHGPTGAGKSSVLDAVCFALYGRVPGGRTALTRLRSDHAEAGAAPSVECEFSVGVRRFEVARSPAWERPKKRGEGTTTEQARVVVREYRDGAWTPLTTRIDEAAHLLEDVLGLGLDQFTQLVLLPQGDFAAFLQADAESRRRLLERLFGTDRFAAVQQWLRDHRAQVRRDTDHAHAVTARLVARADQAAAPVVGFTPVGPGPNGSDHDGAEPEAPQAHLAYLRLAVSQAWEQALGHRIAAQQRLEAALKHGDRTLTLVRLQQEHADLLRRREALGRGADAAEAARRRLLDAERAAGLQPLAEPLRLTRERYARARAALTRLGVDPDSPDGPTDDELLSHGTRLRADLSRLEAAFRDEQLLDGALTTHAGLARRVKHAIAEADRLADEARATTARCAELTRQHTELATLAAGLPEAAAALVRARGRSDAVRERDRLTRDEAALAAELAAAETRYAAAWQAWLDVRERRLSGMAGELAGQLRDGEPCRVCGATGHPAPAHAVAGAAAEDEEAARTLFDAARADAEEVRGRRASLREACAAAVRAADDLDADGAAAAVRAARQRLDAHEGAAAAARQAVEEERAARALLDDLAIRARAVGVGLTDDRAELARSDERVQGLRGRVDAARGEDASLAARRERLAAEAELAEAVVTARRQVRSTGEELARTTATAQAAADRAGFRDLGAAEAAFLDAEMRQRLAEAVRQHDDEAAALDDRMSDPALARAAATGAPDLPAASAAVELARADDEACARAVTLCETADAALAGIATALRDHLRDQEPLLARYRTADGLARCVEGTGGDNALRMNLSAYVLAARLEQVAEAAGMRLARMSGGRYTLAHTDESERGRTRSGLGLAVVDGWTGRRRETASLSGGEAFYTSLALALGLADVVSAESGGTTIETFFVDEGFGSLDDETLEEVMDVLDDLRSGGRAVGLVSHVGDLRDRVPARLEVVKTRTGSSLRMPGSGPAVAS